MFVTVANCLSCMLQNMLAALVMLKIASHKHENRNEFLNLLIDSDFYLPECNCQHNLSVDCGIFREELSMEKSYVEPYVYFVCVL